MTELLPDLDALGHAVAAVAYAAFAVFLLRSEPVPEQARWSRRYFLAAVVLSALWALATVVGLGYRLGPAGTAAFVLDLARYGAWLVFMARLLTPQATAGAPRGWPVWGAGLLMAGSVVAALVVLLGVPVPLDGGRLLLAWTLGLSIYGLVLVEQLFRNQSEESRWNAKPVCLALACIFGFDLYVYAEALLFGRFDPDALNVRGLIHALTVPLLFVAARRHRAWMARLQVSRNAAFYSAALMLVGVYLLFIAAVGYYVRYFGGTWGRALQFALIGAALLLLAMLVFSGALRSRLRVFLGKNFFSYRYDYREQWLRFTAMLSTQGSPQEVGVMVVQGLADMVESPGGSLWSLGLDDKVFAQTAQWNLPLEVEPEPRDSAFCRFMADKDWIIDLEEYRASPRTYDQLVLPRWLLTEARAWVVVPLKVADEMIGFVVLARPRAPLELNWEVRDLLKTASRQAAGYLSRMHATEALLEARKFDAFNRMSAFVVHDLKNIITQLSLMLKNAERHRDNPEFQQDMLMTVESALERMRQMMVQLREGQKPAGSTSGVDLPHLLRDLQAMAAARGRSLELRVVDEVSTRGHEDRLARVLGHLVQNALDATPASGTVWVALRQSAGRVLVEVGDTGAGMSEEFVRTRLFRPFSTTKHSGMGIGSYESYQYIKELGGSIEVDSELGRGTVISVLLPLFDTRKQSDLQMNSAP